MDFPCYMYHAEHGARIFTTLEEFEAAGDGWVDSPAKVGVDEEAGKPSDGLTVPQLKEALTAKGIAIPEGAKKPELATLLDNAPLA